MYSLAIADRLSGCLIDSLCGNYLHDWAFTSTGKLIELPQSIWYETGTLVPETRGPAREGGVTGATRLDSTCQKYVPAACENVPHSEQGALLRESYERSW